MLPFDKLPTETLRASPRKVFAHYFTAFPLSIDNQPLAIDYYTTQFLALNGENNKHVGYGGYLRSRPMSPGPRGGDWFYDNYKLEIQRAIDIGIDGFSVDILDARGSTHFNRLKAMLNAAADVDPGFKILIMPDMEAGYKSKSAQLLGDMLEVAGHPSAYRHNGKVVISPFNAQNFSKPFWSSFLTQMAASGHNVSFWPLFQGWASYQSWADICEGFSDWGNRSPGQQAFRDAPGIAHSLGVKWMAPVCPQDMRPSSQVFWEAENSLLFREMWQNAIDGGADWVQLITWNDYSEHAMIAPSTGTNSAFYDLSAYYIHWFKTGVQPGLTNDALYYFHRAHNSALEPTNQPKLVNSGDGKSAKNEIEALTLLTAPAQVSINNTVTTAPAGVASFKVPLTAGTPTFQVHRGGLPVIEVVSHSPVVTSAQFQNMLYQAGGALSGQVIEDPEDPPVTELEELLAAIAALKVQALAVAAQLAQAQAALTAATVGNVALQAQVDDLEVLANNLTVNGDTAAARAEGYAAGVAALKEAIAILSV